MGQLVHGIVDAAAVPSLPDAELEDAAGGPVSAVISGDLAGLVSDGPDDEVLPTRANLLAHTRVLEILARSSTVLPVRFGTVVPDAETFEQEYLVARRDALRATLDRLEGHDEFRVRATYVEEEIIREILQGDPSAARLRGQQGMQAKMELGERIAQGVEDRRGDDGRRILQSLSEAAADVAPAPPPAGLDVVVASFLVASDELAAFDRTVDEVAERYAPTVTFEVVGPMPPFSFAGEEG